MTSLNWDTFFTIDDIETLVKNVRAKDKYATASDYKNVYLAGPMTGTIDYNYPLFNTTALKLRRQFPEWSIINPAENFDGRTDLPYATYLHKAIEQVLSADIIAVLPGWRESKGASLEVAIANALQLLVVDAQTWEPITETALQEAQRLVHGDRQVAYGHPVDDFTRTGKLWGAILGTDPVKPELVGLCMAAVKISREVNAPKRDNRVDLAGYAETIEMIAQKRAADTL